MLDAAANAPCPRSRRQKTQGVAGCGKRTRSARFEPSDRSQLKSPMMACRCYFRVADVYNALNLTACTGSSNFQASSSFEYSEVETETNMVSPVLGTVRKRYPFSGFALLETLHEPGESLPPHAHSHAYITITVRGTYIEGYRRREDFCSPKWVRFLPAGEKHTNRFHQRTLCLNAELSPTLAERYARSAVTCVAQLRSPFACWIGQKF